MPNFIHLHCHTEYSLVDSLIGVKPLVKKVRDLGMPACAVTDQNNLFALVKFYRAAQAEGIKPIIGTDMQLYDSEEATNRLVLLCQNDTGYRNLTRLLSKSYTEGQIKGIPYLRRHWLNGHTEGLIALSGGRAGDIGQALLAGHSHLVKQYLEDWQALFPQRFYLELQRTGRPHEEEYIYAAVELAQATATPVVATNNVCFLTPEDFEAHEVRVCIHEGNTLADPRRPRHYSAQQYLRSPQEMAALFADLPEAIENTWHIAQRCNLGLILGKNFLPNYPIPTGQTTEEYFRQQAHLGLEERLATIFDQTRPEFAQQRRPYDERLARELDVIIQMGFPGYFLIVSDFIQWAKDNHIPVGPGRGSGAGSLVAYALQITDLDPLKYDLLFERFLNPERVSMPDFDIDFCQEGRDKVIDYVAKRYGRERVSQIITYGSMAAKAVIRDVGRVLSHPHGFVDKIAKLIPFEVGITLEEALEKEDELRTRYRREEEVRLLIDMAKKLEGLVRNPGKHAGGVVIAPTLLTDFTPLYCEEGSTDLITQFDKDDVEAIGLVKFDFLGLRTLTIIDWALENIKRSRDTAINISQIPLDDAATFDLLKRGQTTAVFQLESTGIKKLIRDLRPDCFEDLVALVALYRPGPLQSGMVKDFIDRKHKRARVEYPHPDLASILKPTYGVIVYQEQVMQIAQVLAGYTLGGADLLRRAMGKKKHEEMAKQKAVFIEGAKGRGVKEETATYIFDLMEKFAEYGFNRCLTGDTFIANPTTGELHTIKELYQHRHLKVIVSVQPDFKLKLSPVVNVMENGMKPVFTLTTSLGKQITVTGNHPFLTLPGWKPLEKLKVGDRIASPARLPIEGSEKWPNYELITLGWTLAEGNTCHPSGFYFYNNEIAAVEDFVVAASQFRNTLPTVYQRPDGRWEVYVGTGQNRRVQASRYTNTRTTFEGRSGARLWLEGLGLVGVKSVDKSVPKEIFQLTNKCLALFLGRFWSGDGFVANHHDATPYVATSSLTLARQLQHLLLRLQMVSRLTEKRFAYRGGWKIGYTVKLLGRTSIEVFVDNIVPHLVAKTSQIEYLKHYLANTPRDRESIDTVPPEVKLWIRAEKERHGLVWRDIEILSGVCTKEFYGTLKSSKRGFRRGTIRRLAQFFNSDKLWQAASPDIFWERVVDIEPAGLAMTYDLEVGDTHSFVANDLLVHNSHSAAYALISYQTAWLKTHYPAAFMAAVLSSDMDKTEKIVHFIDECNMMNLKMLPPDVNLCDYKFTVAENQTNAIRYGLGALKGVGEAALENIFTERQEHGPFTDLFDFCRRIDLRKANRRVLESLIKSGATDALGPHRATLLASIDSAIKLADKHSTEKATGQNDMFSMSSPTKRSQEEKKPFTVVPDWSLNDKLQGEKDVLGLYLSGHPIQAYLPELKQLSAVPLARLKTTESDQTVRVGGWVEEIRFAYAYNKRMAFLTLEDEKGRLEVKVSPELCEQKQNILVKNTLLIVTGKVREDNYNEGYTMTADQIYDLDQARGTQARRIEMIVSVSQAQAPGLVQRLLDILTPYRQEGRCRVVICYFHPEAEVELLLGEKWHVQPQQTLLQQLQELLGGEEKVKVVY